MSPVQANAEHIVTFPFPTLHSEGGLTSVFLNEAKLPDRTITFITTDDSPRRLGSAEVVPATAADFDMGKVYQRWFGYNWNIMFDRAYTQLPQEILREMYVADVSARQIGTFEHLVEYSEKLAPSAEFDKLFSDRFQKPIATLIAERPITAVNFTDVFWYPELISEIAPGLREKGTYTSIHVHTSISDNLYRSEFGRKLLQALSAVDEVFVHTEKYSASLEAQLRGLDLPVPGIQRFDLGANLSWVRSSLEESRMSDVPGFDAFDVSTKALVKEALGTLAIPHRFVCPDRIEATKALHSVLDGVDLFLSERAKAGEDLRSEYRFFFLHELWTLKADNPHKPMDMYIKVIKEKHAALAEKYPGVVWASSSIKGEGRVVLPKIMAGCHGLNGAMEDGLGLTSMEIAEANMGYDNALISGNGSGFALEAMRRGFADTMMLVDPQSPRAFADAMHRAVRLQNEHPGTLLQGNARLVNDFVRTRNDSVIVSSGK